MSGSGSSGGGAGGGGMSGGGGASSPSHSAANSTLNRPMSSQGGTRYEDKTLSLQRSNNASGFANPNNNGQANRQQSYRVNRYLFFFCCSPPLHFRCSTSHKFISL